MMKNTARLVAIGLLGALSAVSLSVRAEKADREKPINLEADRITMDDLNKVQVFEGNVVLTQGTLQIRTSKLVVTQDDDGFQKCVATSGAGGLARFKQKREGRDEYIEGQAERIVHNARDEKTEFSVRAWVKSGLDEVKGQYVLYDALTEKYLVTNAAGQPRSSSAAAPTAERVRAIIQPKSKNAAASENKPSEPLSLKPATSTGGK